MCDCDRAQSRNRHHSAEKISPLEGLKRSERLRDRRVHYADMIHGIHPRHSAVDGSDSEQKTGETSHHHNSHQSATKADTVPLQQGLCTRSGGQSLSSQRAKLDAAAVEPMLGATPVNCRRKSLELRSTASNQISDVAAERKTVHPLVADSSASPAGRRQLSGHRQSAEEEIPGTAVTPNAGTVERGVEQPLVKPSTVSRRRHRGSIRHRRRMAARRRSNLSSLSSPPANLSLHPTTHTLSSNSSLEVADMESSQQNIATGDFHEVDKPIVCIPVRSVKFASTADASVSKLVEDTSCKMASEVVQSSVGCCDLKDAEVPMTDESLASVGVDKSAIQSLCRGSIESYTPKHETPRVNLVPVMHVDFHSRVGRRRYIQNGVVLLDHYVSEDAACVRCCSCPQLLSVNEFIHHMHHAVRSVRRFGPRGIVGPEWHEFLHRRAKFAVGSCSKTPVNPPAVDQVINTATAEATSPGSADNQTTTDVAVVNTDEVKTKKVKNPPVMPVANQLVTNTGVVDSPPSMPLSAQVGERAADMDKNPAPAVDKVTQSILDSCSSVGVVGSSRPLPASGTPPSCPAAVDMTLSAYEPRVTRSRTTNVSHIEPSPGVPSLRRQSTAADTPDSAACQSERSGKRARVHSATATPAQQADAAGDSSGSRRELRPRPPPRATAPK